MITCQCNVYPIIPRSYILKMGLLGVYIFLISALKHHLIEAAPRFMFEQKYEKYYNFSSDYYLFYNIIKLMHSFSVNIRICQPSKVMSTEAIQQLFCHKSF